MLLPLTDNCLWCIHVCEQCTD